MEERPAIFHKFYGLTSWILDRLERYPRSVRIVLADRMGMLCMDILERVIQAQYTRRRRELLQEINLRYDLPEADDSEKMRVAVGRQCKANTDLLAIDDVKVYEALPKDEGDDKDEKGKKK